VAKYITIAILIALVIVFVLQNIEVVEVRFLAWTISMSRALMLVAILLIGIVAGLLAIRPKARE
jgi:uncharacterized integral membrane protein